MYKLKKLRLKYGYTCNQMAFKLKISKPYYWQLENHQKRLTYQLAIGISSVFNMTPDQIFYDDYMKKINYKKRVFSKI